MSGCDKGDYREHREAQQARRHAAVADAPAELERRGFTWRTADDGYHIIIQHEGHTVDYWPSRGKWMIRHSGRRGRGLAKLEAYLTGKNEEAGR